MEHCVRLVVNTVLHVIAFSFLLLKNYTAAEFQTEQEKLSWLSYFDFNANQ